MRPFNDQSEFKSTIEVTSAGDDFADFAWWHWTATVAFGDIVAVSRGQATSAAQAEDQARAACGILRIGIVAAVKAIKEQ